MTRVALWIRVSTDEQNELNQLDALEAWAGRRGWEVRTTYMHVGSAWTGSQDPQLGELLDAASRGEFDLVATWSLDRLERRGPLEVLRLVDRLGRCGVQVVSLQEPWVEASSAELRDLLLAIAAWVARWESQRRSERTRAGLDRARAAGKRLGRPPGSRDGKKRSRRGYLLRYGQ